MTSLNKDGVGEVVAHGIAKKLTKALVGLTPGGSEYFTRCEPLDDYFADPDACVRVVRERFDSGHAAKIENVDLRRALETSQARALAAERERDEAIGKWEAADGMDGAVVHAIREVLNAQSVPRSAFIDDHVANAIHQRNSAEARVKELTAALEFYAKPENYKGEFVPGGRTDHGTFAMAHHVNAVRKDAGEIARKALQHNGEGDTNG